MDVLEEHPLRDEIVYDGFTQRELHEAFSKVQNKENWKMPVDARIPCSGDDIADVEELRKIKAATVYFTASVARIYREGKEWHIIADGYYNAVGA